MKRSLLAAGVLWLVASGAMAQSLWGDTVAGMTYSQVGAVVQGMAPIAVPYTVGRHPGVVFRGELRPVAVLGQIGFAEFGFDALRDELRTVRLRFSPEQIDQRTWGLQCDSFAAALRGRYGQEAGVLRDPLIQKIDYQWYVGATQIELSCHYALPTVAGFIISYDIVDTGL